MTAVLPDTVFWFLWRLNRLAADRHSGPVYTPPPVIQTERNQCERFGFILAHITLLPIYVWTKLIFLSTKAVTATAKKIILNKTTHLSGSQKLLDDGWADGCRNGLDFIKDCFQEVSRALTNTNASIEQLFVMKRCRTVKLLSDECPMCVLQEEKDLVVHPSDNLPNQSEGQSPQLSPLPLQTFRADESSTHDPL